MPNLLQAEPHTPNTWEETFALLHHLWGCAKDGRYDKAAWCRFAERLYLVAEADGYQRAALRNGRVT